ncbi:MAG: NAD-dependent deacylase [Acidobacteria bacterium]|nr:NAD-dependent deacylase [Acidobacteriota bacterium]
MTARLAALASRLGRAERLTILTGAGVSAASGVPTFRGAAGLWRQYRPEDLATPEAFGRDPRLVWEWYAGRRETIAACAPNAAHVVIAAWSGRPGCRVVTQNVDDLHLRAGTRNLVRMHGSIWELTCWDGCAAGSDPWRDERVPLPDLPPRCPHCGGVARPAVVWFGEALRPAQLRGAVQATACDVFLAVGTSALVYPAAGLVHEARAHGAFTAEINLEETPASDAVDVAIHGAAEDILPHLSRLARQPPAD